MKKISIVGRGLDPAKHLSLEAIRTLKKADIIVGMETEEKGWEEICAEFKIGKFTNISHLYKDGAKDLENYYSFINYVLENLKIHDHIALVVAGHPRLGVTFAQLLTQFKKNQTVDFELNVIEGLSSFDIMLNDLEIDPLERGTSLLDANRLLLFNYHLEPSLNHFIYHVCSVGTEKVHFLDPSKDNRLIDLQIHLSKFFAANKVIYLCKASNGENQQGQYTGLQLKDLSNNLNLVDFGTTLFIPADKPKNFNVNFYKSLVETL